MTTIISGDATLLRQVAHDEGVFAITLIELATTGTLVDHRLASHAWRHMSSVQKQEVLRMYYAMRKILH